MTAVTSATFLTMVTMVKVASLFMASGSYPLGVLLQVEVGVKDVALVRVFCPEAELRAREALREVDAADLNDDGRLAGGAAAYGGD